MFRFHYGYENALHSWAMEDTLWLLVFSEKHVLFNELLSVSASLLAMYLSLIQPPTFLQLSSQPLRMFRFIKFFPFGLSS